MKNRLLVVVSDLHCGSEVGLSPRRFTLRNGNVVTIGDNLVQQWLADQWEYSIARVASIIGHDPATLLVNGDATEGVHHRNNKELIAAEMDRHLDMANAVLEPLAKLCRKRFVVRGTECHTAELENILAQELKAETRTARDKWLLEIAGCLVDAAHHMSTTGRAYLEASAMGIFMGNARLNYARMGHTIPKVFLRAHRHCGGWFCDGTGLLAVTGAWQFLTRHGLKVVTDSIPSPTVMVLDWRGKKDGELPEVHEIKSIPPKAEITRV